MKLEIEFFEQGNRLNGCIVNATHMTEDQIEDLRVIQEIFGRNEINFIRTEG